MLAILAAGVGLQAAVLARGGGPWKPLSLALPFTLATSSDTAVSSRAS